MEIVNPIEKAPRFVIRPSRGWAALNLREIWEFRDLLLTLSVRDLKLRYKQTALGAIWVVLQPLLAAGVFSFVFGAVAKLPSDGLPYFLFSYAGLLGWNLFNSVITKSGASLMGNSQLISKVYFPRLILPLSAVPSVLVDFGVAAAMMAAMLMVYHVTPPLALLLLLPVWGIMLVMLGLGLGFIATSLSVSYRDVQYILPVGMQILLYASPIAYSVAQVPAKWRAVYAMNPLSAPLIAFRGSLLGSPMPSLGSLAGSAAISLLLFMAGVYAFKRMERKFADVI